ncbi:NAD-dependent epimerase/dehydratase [Ectocarpus siliculosus]|uniref:NAD-dependent epimerase/dehydratase n=1 Tax=Ectocarpus siliculosus TaxID=2880 RepID=D7FKG5_ECTSI|nr:NAD-dependent epimerase/dehydratase [Ectocarpus siliculosus]|eukprot:CBJ29367.1 NAD-dependent epimerase/dehydratase [Ectocarpus siliculosus]
MMQPEPLSVLASATCVLSTVPPALQSGADPVLVAHEAELQWARSKGNLRWVGYLSSTGVYGDRGGGWVTEEDEPWPAAPRTKARLKAERSWLRLHERDGLPVHVFRLAGIYGPGRSALDAVARHNGDIRLAGSDDGTMVSRTHVSDIVGVVEASIELPAPGMVLNVADDLPSTRYEARRGGGNKRVDNERMRALLAASGRSLTFPDYRSGLKAVHEGDGRPFTAEEPTVEPASGQHGGRSVAPSFDAANANATTAAAAGGRQEEGDVSAQLGALNAQVARLEAKLGRMLTILEERDTSSSGGGVVAAVGAAANEDGKPASDGGCVGGQSEEGVVGEASISRGETVLWEEGEALPDGIKHLAGDADS